MNWNPPMTLRQIELARHALGLTRPETRKSYRNHFVAGPDHVDYAEWVAMAKAGNAIQRKVRGFGGDDLFHLTMAGADAALRPGESLDHEDFRFLEQTPDMNSKLMEAAAEAASGRIGRITVWSSTGVGVSVTAPQDRMIEIGVGTKRVKIHIDDWTKLHAVATQTDRMPAE